LPHTSRPLKAIAGDRLDANVCADVYDLYVKYIVKRALSLLATHLPFVESGSPDMNYVCKERALAFNSFGKPFHTSESMPSLLSPRFIRRK
jgi:hypothetical protein